MSQRGSDDTQRQGLVYDRRFPHRAEHSVSLSLENGHSRIDGVGGPSYEDILLRTDVDRSGTHTQPERQSEATDIVPPSAVSAASAQKKPRKLLQLGRQNPPRPKVYTARRPPTSAALLPENRYCHEDGLVKPFRAHHCRHCGTVSHSYHRRSSLYVLRHLLSRLSVFSNTTITVPVGNHLSLEKLLFIVPSKG